MWKCKTLEFPRTKLVYCSLVSYFSGRKKISDSFKYLLWLEWENFLENDVINNFNNIQCDVSNDPTGCIRFIKLKRSTMVSDLIKCATEFATKVSMKQVRVSLAVKISKHSRFSHYNETVGNFHFERWWCFVIMT